jgi:hypothetical protein
VPRFQKSGVKLNMLSHILGVKNSAAQIMRKAAKRMAMLAGFGIILATPAIPYELPTTPSGVWTGSGITTGTVTFGTGTLGVETGTYYKTTPSGLRMSVTVDGTFPPGSGSFFLQPGNNDTTSMTPSAAGSTPGPFTTNPLLPTGVNSLWMGASVFTCKTTAPTSTTCNGIGTVKVTFTDPLGQPVPVVQPKIHLTRLGGTVGAMELAAGWQTNSTGLTLAGANTVTLGVRNGNEFFGDPNAPGTLLNTNCGVSATTTSGCGTVQVTSTVSQMDFNVNAYRTTAGANAWGDGADGFFFDMTFDEDFGSLPTTYEGGGIAAANLLTDLRLGAAVSAENTSTAAHANGGVNASGMLTTSPAAIAAGAAPTDSADGVVFPLLTTAMGGTTYTVTPTLSGASRAGVICGWIDFDKSGTFAPATEGVCQPFAAGATSVPMNFTIANTNFAAGPTYARFRTTYDTAMTTSSFNGLFSSGETEDYQIHIKPLVKVNKVVNPTADTGTFNLLINGTTLATAISNGGSTGDRTVYHAGSPDVTVATNITTAAITGVAITETAAGATIMADYSTTSACVDGNGAVVTPGGTPAAPTITIPQSSGNNAKAQTITCTLTNVKIPKVKVQKSTIGGFGGPFTFAQTNLASAPAGITTTAVSTPTPAAPTSIYATTIGTAVTLTETPSAGYVLTGATCTDANSAVTGNTGTIGSFAGNVVTIPGANIKAGADFTCLITNTRSVVNVQKTTIGGFGGPFTFAQTNLASAPAGITTTTVLTPTPAAPTPIAVTTVGTAVTLTETPAAGYVLTGVSCSDANAATTSNPGTWGSFAGNVVTIPAANVKAGSNITCNITNTKTPTIKVQKTTLGNFGGPFTFAQTNLASAPANITTTAVSTATPAAPTAINITAIGTAVTVTETPTTGYALTSAACTDAASAITGNNGSIGTLAGNVLTIPAGNVVAGADYTCAFTNTKAPTVKVQKTTIGGFGGPFAFAQTNLASTPANITTTAAATATPAAPTAINVTATGTAVTLTETPLAGYALTAASCTDANSAITGNTGSIGALAGNVLTIPAANVVNGADFTCAFTNTKLPTLQLTKVSNGAVGAFTFTGTNGWTSQNITTTASGTGVAGAVQTLTAAGVATTITETVPAGYVLATPTCTGLGSGAASFSGGILTLDAAATAAGNVIACTFTNTKTPTLKLQKTTTGGFGGPFTFAQTNLASAPASITTTAAATLTPAAPTAIDVTAIGTAITITETPAAGYAATAASCTDANSAITNNTGSFGTLAGNVLTIAAANVKAGADFTCAFTNTKLPTIQVSKTSQGGVGGFTFTGTNGWTSQTITTVTAGTAVSGAVQTLTAAGVATTLTESIPVGYAMTAASCSGIGSGTATPNLAAGTIALDAAATAAGNVIACSVTNSKLPTIQVSKTSQGGVGGFTFTGTNGWANQTITTTTAGTAVSGAVQTLAAAGVATTLTESIPVGYSMTAASCSGIGAGTATPNLAAGTITLDAAATAAGNVIACSVTNTKLPTIQVSKTSQGGVGGFTFTGTNGWTSQTITTVTAGTAVSGAVQTLTAAGTATTLTESIPVGYAMTAASCSGIGAGTATPNLAAGTIALDAAAIAAGNVIACSVTNTKLPTIQVSKTSQGGVGGFTFTGTNGWVSQTITTATAGTAVSGAVQTLTSAGVATTLTETIPVGYAMTAASCSGIGAGTATPNLAAGTIALNAAATAAGNVISCSITNTKLPTIQVSKTSQGGVGGFTFTGTNGWTSQTITTATAGTAVSGAVQTLAAAGVATTLTESIPVGYAMTAASCSGIGAGTATPNLAAGTIALDAAATAAGNVISCSVTNTKLPTIQVSKTSQGGVGGFTFTGTNGWTSQTITTVTAGTAVSGAVQTLTAAGVATTLTESIPVGYAMTAATCSGIGAGTATPNLAAGTIALNAAATAAGNVIACSVTNSKLPTVQVSKTSQGGVGGFTFTGTNGWTSQTITTVTAGTAVSGAVQTLTAAGVATTLTETIPVGYAMTAASCSGIGAGTATPNLAAGTIALDAAATAAGNVISCAVTNTKLPTIQVTKTSLGGVGGFTFTGTNGWTSQTITTVTAGTAVSGAVQILTASGVATTLTETIPVGYAMTAASCSGLGSGTATPNLAAGTIALNAAATAAGNVITCSVTNTKLPSLTLVKTITNDNGGAAALASFPLTAAGPVTITGVSGAAAVTSQLVPVGTYALSETTLPTYAASAWSCTAGTLAGANLTLAAGQTATCTINNNDIAPTLTLRKTTTGGVNTFAFTGNNGFGSDSITTLVAGTPVSGVLKTLTLGNTATDITETVTPGYFLNGAPTCTGMGAGGTVTLVSGSTYRLDAAATANASNIICTFSNTLAMPQLAVAKSANVTSINAAGNSITYTIAVSNPGNVTITAITVADPLGTVICAVSGNATIASLAPSASQNCTITYIVPQSVIDNNGGGDGKIDNTATASGSYGATAVSGNGSAAVNIIRNPLLTIVKTANPTTAQPAGGVITYTYKVTNAGNVTMTGVNVSDAHNGTGVLVGPTNETLTTDTAPTGDSTDPAINGTWATLAPGDVVTFTATYTVTQHDVDFLQ